MLQSNLEKELKYNILFDGLCYHQQLHSCMYMVKSILSMFMYGILLQPSGG